MSYKDSLDNEDNEDNEIWYDWDDEDCRSGLHHFDIWNKALGMNPIEGIEVHSREDLMGLYLLLDSPNPFNDADPYDIFY